VRAHHGDHLGREVVVPHGETVLKAGDEVLILSECGEETLLRKTFGVHAEKM
jgi:Trk K+ transport system NAD-binding subunit